MEVVIDIAVIMLVSLTVVTVFAVLYYAVLALIFKKKDTADSMGHVVASGTIIMTLCVLVFSVYTRTQQSVPYDNGYTDGVNDVRCIAEEYAPGSFSSYSFLEYVSNNYSNDKDLMMFASEIGKYIDDCKTAFYFITEPNPTSIKNIISEIKR